MTEISPNLVRELREKSGAGMMDCKKALVENNGDLEAAVDWLRKKGLAAAAKKAGRVAAEGLVGVAASGNAAAAVEINAETDFISRNEQFQKMVLQAAEAAASKDYTIESLAQAPFKGETATIGEEMTRLIAVIGENMNMRRVQRLSVQNGIVATYVHNATAPGLGRIGVLVALESTGDTAKLQELGKKIAMHVAAASPQSLDVESLDASALERERAVLIEQAKASGRPDDVIQKMVEGRVRKFYEEVVLLEQAFVMDGKTKISDVVAQFAKEIGSPITLTGFVRYNLGEGIEKEETDFAAEVQAQAKIAG
ncbi:MAG: translation elongation factor Ts [Pseudomonadota bacterium]|jgi:elongation factor Ts|nr:translation elongation factor Ts [Alphaproteobacteria bacterium]